MLHYAGYSEIFIQTPDGGKRKKVYFYSNCLNVCCFQMLVQCSIVLNAGKWWSGRWLLLDYTRSPPSRWMVAINLPEDSENVNKKPFSSHAELVDFCPPPQSEPSIPSPASPCSQPRAKRRRRRQEVILKAIARMNKKKKKKVRNTRACKIPTWTPPCHPWMK